MQAREARVWAGPDALDEALRRTLEPGEFVRWQGRPLGRLRSASFAIWLFAVPWTAFALFWTGAASMATRADALGLWGWIFPLWGVPFICIGLGMMAGPFAPLVMSRRTLFAVTDRRVIRLTRWRSLKTLTVSGQQLGQIERREYRDASGSLRVAIGTSRDSDGDLRTDWLDFGDHRNIAALESQIRRLAGG